MTTMNIRSDPMATWECSKQIQDSPASSQLLIFQLHSVCERLFWMLLPVTNRVLRTAFLLAVVVYYDVWNVVGINVSRLLGPRPSQRGCLLILPLSVFTIDRAYQTLKAIHLTQRYFVRVWDQRHLQRFTCKRRPALHLRTIVPLNFAHFTLPTNGNRWVKLKLLQRHSDALEGGREG